MATEQSWRYKVKDNDPSKAITVLGELMEEGNDDELTELDLSDDFECPVKGCIVNQSGKEALIALDEKPIRLDYTEQTIKLPEELVGLYPLDGTSVPANLVRYVAMPIGGFNSERNEGTVVVLSLWNSKRDIVNVNLLAEDSKQAMILLNAVTRLVYESSGKNGPRTHRFYPIDEGPVDVTSCSTAKRDRMDEEKERRGLVRKQQFGTDEKAKQSDEPEDEQTEMQLEPKFYVFDEEALLLYDWAFAPVPSVDLRFYREETNPKTIETIFVCKIDNQLEIQQGKKIYIVRARKGEKRSEEAYARLIKFLKNGRVKPKYEDTFKGTGSDFEKIFSNKAPEPYETDSDEALGDLKGNPIVNAVPKRSKYSKKVSAEPSGSRPSGLSGNMTRMSNTIIVPESSEVAQRNKIWLENMRTADHVTEVVIRTDDAQSARMQQEWFEREAKLQEILDKGTEIEVGQDDPLSNWDPQSVTDACRALNLVRDSIMTRNYVEAITRLRRCLSVFDKTLLGGVEEKEGLMEVMKRVYFLQDRPTGM